ncbi:MAG TPA: hypothetical protein VFL91_00450 [Thermomicrobiales bacterium]|nr:hypothetical protein [Thermomicrobiales bacterium]
MTQRVMPLTGAGFFALFLVGFGLSGGGGEPGDTASGQTVVSYYAAHSTQIHLALFLMAFAALLLAFFVAYLHSVVRAAGDGSRPLAAAVLAGGVIWSVGLFASAATHDALLQAALHGQVDVVNTLNVLGGSDFFPIVGGIAIYALAAGIAGVRGAGLPAWLGWLAILIGLLALAGPLGMIAFIAAPIWVLVTSIALATRGLAVGMGTVEPARP